MVLGLQFVARGIACLADRASARLGLCFKNRVACKRPYGPRFSLSFIICIMCILLCISNS